MIVFLVYQTLKSDLQPDQITTFLWLYLVKLWNDDQLWFYLQEIVCQLVSVEFLNANMFTHLLQNTGGPIIFEFYKQKIIAYPSCDLIVQSVNTVSNLSLKVPLVWCGGPVSLSFSFFPFHYLCRGRQSTVGRALDWGWRECWFEHHRWHSQSVVSLSKILFLLFTFVVLVQPRKTWKIVDWDVKNQTKQNLSGRFHNILLTGT